MEDIAAAIEITKLLITASESLAGEIGKAKLALESGTAQLKEALADAQKLHDQLAADRKTEDDALDKKFDKGAP